MQRIGEREKPVNLRAILENKKTVKCQAPRGLDLRTNSTGEAVAHPE